MALILGDLTALKTAVLPENLVDNEDFDTAINAIGLGVAMAMEKFCNRKFERVVGDTFERSADCSFISLPRFPVETVSEVAIKSDEASGFIAQPANTLLTVNKTSGIVEFGYNLGLWRDRVRVTYTGGFWNGIGTQPVGSTPVPGDLLHAWHLQVQREIEAANVLKGGAAATAGGADAETGRAIALTDRVKEMLQPFVRYS